MTTLDRRRRRAHNRVTARQRKMLLRKLNSDARKLEREFASELEDAFDALGKMAEDAAKEVL